MYTKCFLKWSDSFGLLTTNNELTLPVSCEYVHKVFLGVGWQLWALENKGITLHVMLKYIPTFCNQFLLGNEFYWTIIIFSKTGSEGSPCIVHCLY